MTSTVEPAPEQPQTRVTRLREKQRVDREGLFELLDSTPLATVALIRDGLPAAFPIGFTRLGDDLVIHGSTGSPWLRALSDGASAAVSVTTLDGVVVARSGFESSFHYRSAIIFGRFDQIADHEKLAVLNALTDTFIPGRVAELRTSNRRELAATLALRLPITADNWSLKVSDGWPEDPEEDIAAGAWAGVVPLTVQYGTPRRAPDCDASIPEPASVQAMTGSPMRRSTG
ncbi:pyridoxamine 5'-phosphate oxidase family protein [Mycolicibacterium sp. BiH015]|uniref:pyridoxamine 5'-phosphate oxidase family protein n=1 Tax=Mycolicibacterium sp. BiH015 TaxID=3018808 RepID=UPI0022E90E04|nr:pyridoxamine 5'-phosphate oxidase family protein [Mycolicibacterium sp. BiH015]MDA2890602.1 pyridoxamine 5'-phosphate oxidase family protein [Mycolicibacterium sp. BiH015]